MRISFNNRNLGYPLLTPDGGDYQSCVFDIDTPQVAIRDDYIIIDLSYRNSSRAVSELIDSGKANYLTLVANDVTFQRTSTPQTAQTVQTIRLPQQQYHGMIQLMPYVVATQQIPGFIHDEHHHEYSEISPNGFNVEPGMILAVGNTHNINLAAKTDIPSVVDIRPTSRIENRIFEVHLDDRYITVYCSPQDYEAINQIRNDQRPSRSASLWPSLYLHILTEGIGGLPEHLDNHWAAAVQRELSEIGADPEDAEDLRVNALKYAQTIIRARQHKSPLALMIDAFNYEDAQAVGKLP